MPVPVIMPKLEMTQETATVIEWLKREGEQVRQGEPLLTVETDKVTVEIEAPATGILAQVQAAPGQVVPVTEVIAQVLLPGEHGERIDDAKERPGIEDPVTIGSGTAPEAPVAPSQRQSLPAFATPVAQRMAAAVGMDLSALPPGTGPRGKATKADVVAALEPVQSGQETTLDSQNRVKVRATPAARRAARERGVNLKQVTGSGPRGRVQAADVAAPEASRATELRYVPLAESGLEGVQVVPLAGMRRTVAERMTVSYQTTPHITLTMRVDMGAFEEARAWFNATGKAVSARHVLPRPRANEGRAEARDLGALAESGPHVSVTALIVKAVAWALRRHPWLNSTLRGVEDPAGCCGKEIHLLPEVNVGVAVALEQGLIVPVLHAADRQSLMETAADINDLTARAREGRLTPADVAGGTFTVTNLGVFGIEQFTAIINPPQAAILAVGAVQPEAVVKGGQVAVRPMMRMTLSADHRIVDGAVAARFMSDLRDALENPVLLI